MFLRGEEETPRYYLDQEHPRAVTDAICEFWRYRWLAMRLKNPDVLDRVRRFQIILDAKYRTSEESIQEALRDIHVYRDALRHGSSLASARGAFIITPGCKGNASVYFKDSYRKKHNFGGFVFSLGNNDQSRDFLEMLCDISLINC